MRLVILRKVSCVEGHSAFAAASGSPNSAHACVKMSKLC